MSKNYLIILLPVFWMLPGCPSQETNGKGEREFAHATYIKILGIAQDAGYPQADCQKDCCRPVWAGKSKREKVSCLGLIDRKARKAWLLDATPDFKDQLHALQKENVFLEGIFLTHAHIGHYTGLMHLGREAMGAEGMPVFAMPRMQTFLEANGPWSQLVELGNIDIRPLITDSIVSFSSDIQVIPFTVPHRDEFSETAGYRIDGPERSAIFIPDIDKWRLWDKDIIQLIGEVDYAFLDGTFYANGEIPGRDMSEIPHPFIEESMALFAQLPPEEKAKIHFIHFNHTNPILQKGSAARKKVLDSGFRLAEEGDRFGL